MPPCLLHLKAWVNPGPHSQYPSIYQHSEHIKLSTPAAGCSHIPRTRTWNHLPAELGPRYPRRYSFTARDPTPLKVQPNHNTELSFPPVRTQALPSPCTPCSGHTNCNSPALRHVQTDTEDKRPIPLDRPPSLHARRPQHLPLAAHGALLLPA